MKIKTSMKYCKSFAKVFCTGYCELQKIFRTPEFEPRFYNCGVYGWNCDLYVDYANDMVIITGYRNMRGRSIPSDLIEKYNKRADKITASDKDWTWKRDKYNANAERFLEELATL